MRNKCEKKHKFFRYSQFWTILLQGFLSRIAGVQLRREGAPQWPVEWPQSLLCKSKPIFQQTFIIEMILIIELIMEWPKSTQATSAPKARGSRRFSTRRGWCQKIHQRFFFSLYFQEPAHPLANSGPESLSPGHSAPVPRLTQATPASVAKLLRSWTSYNIWEWFKTFHVNFQSQRYRPGSNAGAGLDHQSSHSLGREAAETSPWGGHQQEVEVAGLFKYHCKTILAQLMKMSQGNCGPMVMVITNENQSENAFSTYLLRLGLALESFKEPL